MILKKNEFIEQLNHVLDKLNIMIDETASIQHIDVMRLNERWNMFPVHIREQVKDEKKQN